MPLDPEFVAETRAWLGCATLLSDFAGIQGRTSGGSLDTTAS